MDPLETGVRNLVLAKSQVDLQLVTQYLEGLAKSKADIQLGTLDMGGCQVIYIGHHESMEITPYMTNENVDLMSRS